MRTYITKSQLRTWGSELTPQGSVSLRKSLTETVGARATFLSHSSKDDDLVLGATRILTNHGAVVYVDEKDPALPPYVSKKTAAGLKTRINQCGKFVLLASKNSKESRWVPWELGVADGYKGLKKIALFPAVDDPLDTEWTTWEYMGLYQRIVWADLAGHSEPLWLVLDEEDNTGIPLQRWLAS